MKLHILKENLHKAAGMAARFATNKAQLPVLSQTGIEVTKEGVYFWATDLEVGVRVRIGGKVLTPGKMMVPAKLLAELAATLPLGAVELEGEKEQLMVKAGKVRATLMGMSMDDFPTFGEEDETVWLGEMKLEQLSAVLEQTTYAMSSDLARPVLTGLLWELGSRTVVATDGYRLSMIKKAMPKVAGKVGEKKLVVGGALVREMSRALSDMGVEVVKIGYGEAKQQLLAVGEDILLMGRVVGGDFPDYRAILPGEPEIAVSFGREELTQAVKTASIFARESANIIKFSFDGENAKVAANAAQVGSNEIALEVAYEKSGQGAIAFNSRYLLDFLTRANQDRVRLSMGGALKASGWSEEGNENYLHVIMPVRVKGED